MKIAFFHGLGGKPANDRMDYLTSLGYEVYYPHIDYLYEYNKDNFNSLFKNMSSNVADCDLLMGTSMGGYLTYKMALYTGKNGILINPALNQDRNNLKNYFNEKFISKMPNLEVYFGKLDTSVLMINQIPILENEFDLYNNIDPHIISDMKHRVPIHNFKEICTLSKFL